MNTFDLHRFELTDTSGQAWQVEACSTRPSDWDAWMLQVDTTNYLQAGVCAEFEQRLRCGQPVYITLHNAGNIAGRLLLFREPTAAGFFLGSAFRRRTLLPAMHHLPGKLHWLEGPVLNNALPVQEALRLFLQAVDKLVRPLNAVEVSHATLPRGIGQEETQELEQGMSDFGYASQPWVSYIIHLDQPEEILWKNLNLR
ncbi:MAG: hypothetical protein O2954_04065, partial [bacterium]|nr:hypothetical protein [bacterium]